MIDSFRNEYFFLSNFYPAPVTFENVTYANNEAAFQAQKTLDLEKRKEFARLKPSEAKSKGRALKLRRDWNDVKTNIMLKIVRAKFEQNPDIAKKLIETGDKVLIEGNDWGDRIWGAVDGVGENRLGEILMTVRSELRAAAFSN